MQTQKQHTQNTHTLNKTHTQNKRTQQTGGEQQQTIQTITTRKHKHAHNTNKDIATEKRHTQTTHTKRTLTFTKKTNR